MGTGRRVLFWVQHLLGVGHVRRASLIAAAMSRAGLDVTVAQGGESVPGIDFGGARIEVLPATRAADAAFSGLVEPDGTPITDRWRARRRERLLNIFEAVRPDVLLVEQFPFGRRQFRFELLPLLAAARESDDPPIVLASVRDILVARNDPERNSEICETVTRYFDGVVVHGDPNLATLDASFPDAAAIAGHLHYTGYVAAPAPADESAAGTDEVIVAAGGGAVGERLLEAALQARSLSSLAGRHWRVLLGPNLDPGSARRLAAQRSGGVVVEPNRPDYPALLRNCALSISQGGYNTVMDILAAGCRSVIVPFAAPGETEQALRARLLADRGLVTVVEEDSLSARTLADAVDRAASGERRRADGIDLDGAAATARLVAAWPSPKG